MNKEFCNEDEVFEFRWLPNGLISPESSGFITFLHHHVDLEGCGDFGSDQFDRCLPFSAGIFGVETPTSEWASVLPQVVHQRREARVRDISLGETYFSVQVCQSGLQSVHEALDLDTGGA